MSDLKCFACDYKVSWKDVQDAINSDEVLDAEDPVAALYKVLDPPRFCCIRIMYDQRLFSTLQTACVERSVQQAFKRGESVENIPKKSIFGDVKL